MSSGAQLQDLVAAIRSAGPPAGPRSDPNAPARPPMPRRVRLAPDIDHDAIVRRVLQLSGHADLDGGART